MEDRSFPERSVSRSFSGKFFRRTGAGAAELAARPAFAIGNATITPSRRTVRGPAGDALLEPRVMQVLVALADAGGGVVTRSALIESCWQGQVVGDDAVNRAISELRRAAREAGADFSVETVPKIGYRIAHDGPWQTAAHASVAVSRRALLAGAGAALVGAVGLTAWWLRRNTRDPRVVQLIERGRQSLREELPDKTQQGVGFFQEATRLAPRDAEAWGYLALAYQNVVEFAAEEEIPAAVQTSESTARRALALDPEQPEALAALALLPAMHGDWLAWERRLLAVHRDHPDQTAVLAGLGLVAGSVGRMRDAAGFVRRGSELDPLSPIFQYRYTYQLWANGRPEEADRTIDRALQLWPTHPAVWVARLLLFAGTDRTAAALHQLGKPEARTILPPPVFEAWKTALDAVEAPAGRAKAIDASMALARQSGSGCVLATLLLCRVGALDEAFTVSEGYLLRRGPLITDIGKLGGTIVETQRWRKTLQLFIPPTAEMRSDARFEALMADVGLADYWREADVTPDYRAQQPVNSVQPN